MSWCRRKDIIFLRRIVDDVNSAESSNRNVLKLH